MESILENNKLIAEFMGAIPSKRFPDGETLEYLYEAPTSTSSYHWSLKGMEYSSRWDWLMPVWKKVGDLIYESRFSISQEEYSRANQITINVMDSFRKVDIEKAYFYILEAIKWYKAQQS